MKKNFILALIINIFSTHIFSANITSVSNVQIIPSNPSPGQTVEVRWDYYVDSEYNNPHALVVVSDTNTLRPANTSGQWVMIGNGCITPPNPESAQVTGGCSLGNNISPAGTHSSIESGTYTFTLPSTLIPGYTYYIIVGMKDYNVYMNPSVDVSAQNYFQFTIPLPPPTIQLSKVAEGSAAQPGGYVLYTIYYYIANTNNVVITDDIPANVTCVEVYDGGTCGNPITWNLGNISIPVRGSVSWLGQISGSVSQGTVIHNTAQGTSNETSATSNDATVTIGASLEINKGAVSNAVQVGDTITYVLTYTNSGFALSEYVDFSTPATEPIPGWTEEVTGATWQIIGGYLQATGPGGQWGKLIKNTPSLHDAMYITDIYVPSSNTSGDAVFIFNFIDQGNMYHARIQSDANQVCFDRVLSTTWSQLQCATPSGFSIQNDRWYTMKVAVQGSNIRIKAWPKGESEPVNWQINYTESSLPLSGRPGYQDNEGEDRFDNLKIFVPAPATNVVIWDTVPDCTTYLSCIGGTSCDHTGASPDVVYFNLGNLGYQYGQITFTVRTEACAGGTYVNNTACIDSTEPAPEVCSNIATVAVGSVATETFTSTSTFTPTSTNTFTFTYTNTITNTPTNTITNTPTNTRTSTLTNTFTFTGTETYTRTYTFTQTVTGTPPPTWTWTDIPTNTFTFTQTHTWTDTATATGTSSPTDTFTSTNTPTNTNSPTETNTATDTRTQTATFTFTNTGTPTSTSTPQPANIALILEAIDTTTTSGGYAKFKITIKNTGSDAFDVILWDSIPSDALFDVNYFENTGWSLNENVFYKNISSVSAGETRTFYFNLKTSEGLSTGHLIYVSPVLSSYSDILNPIAYAVSNPVVISVGEIVVYPNPFNPETAKGNVLKFANIPRNAKIMIYTISGELIKVYTALSAYVFWDGTNAFGDKVSPGIYYYIITWDEGKKIKKDKIFVIGQ